MLHGNHRIIHVSGVFVLGGGIEPSHGAGGHRSRSLRGNLVTLTGRILSRKKSHAALSPVSQIS